MQKAFILLLAWLWIAHPSLAQDQNLPSITISSEDVIQDSIQEFRVTTNQFMVRWTYTEAGARKMLAFWEARAGQKARTSIGSFETAPALIMPPSTTYAKWKQGWLEVPRDKVVHLSEDAAKAVTAGLKKK